MRQNREDNWWTHEKVSKVAWLQKRISDDEQTRANNVVATATQNIKQSMKRNAAQEAVVRKDTRNIMQDAKRNAAQEVVA